MTQQYEYKDAFQPKKSASSIFQYGLTQKEFQEANQIEVQSDYSFTDSSEQVQVPWRLTSHYKMSKIQLRMIQNEVNKAKKQKKQWQSLNYKHICSCGLRYKYESSYSLHCQLCHPLNYMDPDMELPVEQNLNILEDSSTGSESISVQEFYKLYPVQPVYSKKTDTLNKRRSYTQYAGLYNHRWLEHQIRGGIRKKYYVREQPSLGIQKTGFPDDYVVHKYVCFCGKSYLSSATLRVHQKIKHKKKLVGGRPINPDGSYQNNRPKCGCGLTYNNYRALAKHVCIKHMGIPPPGTWGGPISHKKINRHNQSQNDMEPPSGYRESIEDIICSKCKRRKIKSHFWRCVKCSAHFLCKGCYELEEADDDHEWIFNKAEDLTPTSKKISLNLVCFQCQMQCQTKFWECLTCELVSWKWCGNCEEGKQSLHYREHHIRQVEKDKRKLRNEENEQEDREEKNGNEDRSEQTKERKETKQRKETKNHKETNKSKEKKQSKKPIESRNAKETKEDKQLRQQKSKKKKKKQKSD